jgi:hypothetical protein
MNAIDLAFHHRRFARTVREPECIVDKIKVEIAKITVEPSV